MLLIMGVTLYTSRVVLRVLGVEDFGIYNVVGGVVSIMSFFISSLSNVTQRYMNIGLGKQDLMETGCAFRQSLTLMWLLSVLLLLFGETLGLWFVYNKLVIPPERLGAAVWVYHFSLISILSAINQVPLMGAIVAHERMNIYAYLGLFEACARLFIVYLLEAFGTIDSLILYGLLMAIVSVFVWLIYAIYSVRSFTECKFRFYWNYSLVAEMSKFIGQNLFGCFAWSAGVQGTNILLNIFFGPAVNAARAVSVQVSAVVTRFTENMMTAVKPQIIKSYASGDCEYMVTLIEKSSKYAYFLAALIAIPVMVEIEFILEVWLGEVPRLNANPLVPFIVAVLANVGYWFYSLCDIHRQIQLNMRKYFRDVVRPILIFTFSLVLVGSILMLIEPNDSVFRFLIVFSRSVFIGFSVIYSLLQSSERMILHAALKRFVVK